ncbi:T-cell surface antigen CD2-like isoform X2 [Dicentrarchus labrax]|uniref:T-cell surface antigen CD2-like isoform X2 n=1 Tax=Dicentrarchus labrax TaxID=13489 RepID=UPI0021F680A9|nr:T-cell surface antigen CD2-like isoform X2 [Dicentrarchus labrax]
MISIYMIITALVSAALVKGSMECNLSGPTGTQQCVGAPGEPLLFHLPTNTNISKIRLKKNEKFTILNIANNSVIQQYMNNSVFFTNGTFKLNSARRTDSGDYQLQTYGSDGKLLDTIKMHLEIKAPVSKPDVSQMCLSPEQMNISCSSEGEEIEFILTLDGHLLIQTRDHSHSQSSSTLDTLPLAGSTDNQHKPSVSIVTISLHGQLTGNFMCNVRNNISGKETVIHLTSCKVSISHFSVVIAVRAGLIILLLLALCLGVCLAHKKARSITLKDGISKDGILY